LVDQPQGRLVDHARLRLRPSQAARRDGRDARAEPPRIPVFKALCLDAALRVQDGRPATASSATGGFGRDGPAPGRRHRALGRSAGGSARFAAADAGAGTGPDFGGTARMAAGRWSRCCASTIPTTPELKTGRKPGSPGAVRRAQAQRAGIPAGGDPLQGRAGRRDTTADSSSASMIGRLSRLVEARTVANPHGPGNAPCARDRQQRPAHPRHRRAGTRCAEEELAAVLRCRRFQPLVKGFAVGPDDLRRRRRAVAGRRDR
jgi:hypothetical protein